MQFAAKVLPNYSLASKLTFSPDYSSMVDDLSSAVQLTPEGEAVLLKPEMSAENSIAMVLLAARVAHAVGTRPNVEMDPEAISRAIGKAVKTVRNTLAMMTKTGLIDRTTDGRNIRKKYRDSRAPVLAEKLGNLRTMVSTHLLSNVFLIMVPLAGSFLGAIAFLFLRQSISQMDVPTRQAFMAQLFTDEERVPANAVTNTSRSLSGTLDFSEHCRVLEASRVF